MALKIEKIAKSKDRVVFLLKGSTEVFANTVRRLVLEEVPTLAVEDVEIKDNNSALFDEMLALRLGLCPIKTDLKSYNHKESCKCEGVGCAQCELKITLKAGKNGYVYAGEAKSSDPKCTFVQEQMPVVKLLPKQKLDVTLTAILGKGKEHVKWAAGWAIFRRERVLNVSKAKDPKLVASKATDGSVVLKSGKLEVVSDKAHKSQLLEYFSEIDEGITLEHTENIVFDLESWGQLSCKEILQTSADILIEKAEEFEQLI
jgi:DNA-directed RNA polymerase subunit D